MLCCVFVYGISNHGTLPQLPNFSNNSWFCIYVKLTCGGMNVIREMCIDKTWLHQRKVSIDWNTVVLYCLLSSCTFNTVFWYNNNNKYFYKWECLLDVHLSSIRPSTQHSLTTITTWFNNNNKWLWYGINALSRYEVNQSEYNNQ